MKMVGSSKDVARKLMKVADGTPFPEDDDEEFEDSKLLDEKDLDGRKSTGEDLNKETYGKAGKSRRRVQRTGDSNIDKVGVSPDQDREQAINKQGKVEDSAKMIGKAGRSQRIDEDEEIPEEFLPLLDDEVEYIKDFIEEEVERRLQEVEEKEDQERDDETRRMFIEHKEDA